MMKISKQVFVIFILTLIVLNSCAQEPELPTPTPTVEPPPTPPPPNPSLQVGNDSLNVPLSPGRSVDLMDNRIGVHFEGFDRYSDEDHVYSTGFKWIRIQALTEFWGEGDGLAVFDLEMIPQYVDDTISRYVDNGVNIVLDLWVGAGLVPYGTTFQTEDEINRYLEYIRLVVPHFRGRIGYYQIWNEPGDMTPSEYANLVMQAVPVIREEDPDARIIIPGLMGDWNQGQPGYGNHYRFTMDTAYLNELLRSGVAPLVDGISWHPFYGNIPNDFYYQNYPDMVQEIKDLAESEGFTGEYFADELLWLSVTEEGWPGGPPVSRQISAKYYLRAIVMHRGMDMNVTINTFFQQAFMSPIRNLCTAMAGAEPVELVISIAGEADRVVTYGFVLPNGDILAALWTNGEVVEEDPGAAVTVTIEGVSAGSVTGIDVYNGFEQALDFESSGGNLVIPGFLIRDYPIFLRLGE